MRISNDDPLTRDLSNARHAFRGDRRTDIDGNYRASVSLTSFGRLKLESCDTNWL